MKILKITGAAIGLLTAVFILLGVFFSDFEYKNSVVVEATPEKCWNVFHDPSSMNDWMPGFQSLTLKSGEYLQKGSVYEVVITDNGETMVMEETITDIEPGKTVSYKLTNDVLTSVYSFTFSPLSDNQTRIESHYTITGKNLLWRSVLFLSKSMIRRSTQEQLEGVKKIAEQKN